MPEMKPNGKYNIGSIKAGVIGLGGTQEIRGPILVNIDSQLDHVNQQIGLSPHGNPDERQVLASLVSQLKEQLRQAPEGQEMQVATLVNRVTALTNMLEEKEPEPELVIYPLKR
jgi:hypothetical protein